MASRHRAIGRRSACASSTSVAVERIAPVIAKTAVLCIFAICVSALTEPVFFFAPGALLGGVYQTSAAYVSTGMPTAVYSLRMNCIVTPLVVFASLLYALVHLVAFPIARIVWAPHLSSGSI